MELVSPFVDIEMNEMIKLLPRQLNNDIYINLKNNLIKKIEGKCNKHGFIKKIYKIVSYSSGLIHTENLDGSVIFNIKYLCSMCYPLLKTNIICKIDLITKALIKGKNGPLIIIIKINNLNNNNFILENNDIINIKTNEKLIQGDHVIVNIIAKNFYPKDERIILLGNLYSIAKKKEIDNFFNI